MEKSKLNNFKKQLKQYNEKFLITNEDNLITATSTKFIEPTIEEKELDLIKFHQQMLKNNNIQAYIILLSEKLNSNIQLMLKRTETNKVELVFSSLHLI